ncbi:MAG: hypothetical protein GQ470_02425 [Gammaproteobacteria bacterium]|nr:hypothetical protein [Gammaproteobacteria bacterium]
MSNDTIEQSGEKPQSSFESLTDAMHEFREEMEFYDNLGSKIAAKTRFIMRSVFTILIMSSIYIVFMIFQMASSMGTMTTHLEDMYLRFGTMSQDMRAITQSVDSMGQSISGIPQIADSMTEMDSDVSAMSGSINSMNGNITNIDNDMVRINSNMKQMTGSVANINRSVNFMSYDVNQMAAPTSSGPMSAIRPW